MFTLSVRVLLTSVSLKLKINLKYSNINSHRGLVKKYGGGGGGPEHLEKWLIKNT